MKTIQRVSLLSFPIDSVSFHDTLEYVEACLLGSRRLHIVTANVDFVMKARRDKAFARIIESADLVVPDGVPLVWASRMLGCPLPGRVNGTDLAWKCIALARSLNIKVALVGAADDVRSIAATVMLQAYPGLKIVPIPTPTPLTQPVSEQIATTIRAENARLVLVALGAPAQECWIHDYLVHSGASVAIGVGSVFDIISGRRPRAPEWMQRCGLEWLHRLRLEPSRLARRYFVEDSPFVLALLRELFGHRRSRTITQPESSGNEATTDTRSAS